MMRLAELAVFGTLAAGLHVVMLASWSDGDQGGPPARPGAPMPVRAADAALSALVAAWETPPEVASTSKVAPPDTAPGAYRPPVPQATPRVAALPDVPRRQAAQPDRRRQKPQPLPPPKRAERPAEASRAASLGAAGRTPSVPRSTPATSPDAAVLMQAFGAQVRSALSRALVYPERDRSRGITGVPTLVVVISRDGGLQTARILRSSGSSSLDAAAVGTARSARFPAAPAELPGATFAFSVPLRFELH